MNASLDALLEVYEVAEKYCNLQPTSRTSWLDDEPLKASCYLSITCLPVLSSMWQNKDLKLSERSQSIYFIGTAP